MKYIVNVNGLTNINVNISVDRQTTSVCNKPTTTIEKILYNLCAYCTGENHRPLAIIFFH